MKEIIFEKKYTDKDLELGNDVPMYGVSWDVGISSRVGNSWASKEKAISVYRKKEAEGRNPTAREMRVAGFL